MTSPAAVEPLQAPVPPPIKAERPVRSWNARRWLSLRAWGRFGVAGVGILVMCPAFYFSAVRPAEERLAAARSDAVRLSAEAAHGRRAGGDAQGPAGQLAAFYARFPMEKDSPVWLGKLFAAAQARGLALSQGEYTAKRDKAGRLVRFEMTLPVAGEYPRIRQFLSALPTEVPVMALEHVQFERQKVGEPTVQAKLKLVLFLEAAS